MEEHSPAWLRFCESRRKSLAYMAASSRDERAWRREHGICQRCGQNPASAGKLTCEACLARKRARYNMAVYERKLREWMGKEM